MIPKKKKHPFRKLVIYTSLAAGTFYVGSTFVALKFPPYYDVFVENVPLAGSLVQYAEDNNWDALTVAKVIAFLQHQVDNAQKLINGEKIESPVVEKTKHAIESGKDKVKSVARTLKTSVEKSQDAVYERGSKAAAIAKHRSVQFSEGVEDLVQKAEAAIAGKRVDDLPGATTETAQPALPSDKTPLSTTDSATPVVIVPSESKSEKSGDVYDAPLPLGFEPPPGYSRPKPPKPAQPEPAKKEEPAPEPLPLVAPAVKEFSATEPVISQLASVIDNLASFLNSNPAAADKARDILDTAKVDLTQLASRINEVKEEERQKLEAQLDEQTREYTLKLLELEMTAQDKLDSQEEGFRKFFEDEKLKFIEAYREKLNRELEAQSEIINER